MVGVLILTHGPLADELLDAATTISGARSDNVHALSLAWDTSPDEALEIVRAASQRIATEQGVLILTDMYGGTPHNVARRLSQPGRVEVVTGVNLPMVVRLCCSDRRERQLPALAEWISAKGRASICRTEDESSK